MLLVARARTSVSRPGCLTLTHKRKTVLTEVVRTTENSTNRRHQTRCPPKPLTHYSCLPNGKRQGRQRNNTGAIQCRPSSCGASAHPRIRRFGVEAQTIR